MKSSSMEHLLDERSIHDEWDALYRNDETEEFYRAAIREILAESRVIAGSFIFDAGAGSCAHSIRLAQEGLQVCAVDLAEAPLEVGRRIIQAGRMGDRIHSGRGDLTRLPFRDAVFDHTFCWGVLMHVPNVESALTELVRVTKPGGRLIISEVNARSLESVLQRWLRKALHKRGTAKRTPAGVELRVPRPGGQLFIRHIYVRWMIAAFAARSCRLEQRRAGQLLEIYGRLSNPLLRRLVHRLNMWWFRKIRLPHPAVGNIFVFTKAS